MAEPAAALDGFFEDFLLGQIAFGHAPDFHLHFVRRPARTRQLPLNRELDRRPFFRMPTQMRLIGVTFIQTGRKRVLTLVVEKMRKHLHHAGIDSLNSENPTEEEQQHERCY